MNAKTRHDIRVLHEEYDRLDWQIDNAVEVLLHKRNRMFDLAMKLKVLIAEDKINTTSEGVCKHGKAAGKAILSKKEV